MARIVGPANGHATLTGTAGNDLILAYGDANTVTGGGGNDTIAAQSGNDNDIVVGIAMDGLTTLTDIVRADGNGDTVFGGDENVKLAGNVSFAAVTLGRGADTILANGTGNVFTLGGGTDSIRAMGGNNTVNFTGNIGTLYADTVSFSGSHNTLDDSLIFGAYAASGVLDVSGGSGSGTFFLGNTSGTIVTQGVGNFIQGGALGTKIVAGSGYDTVSLTGDQGAHGTDGSANVLLGGTHNLVTGDSLYASVSGGMGYDTLNFSAPVQDTFIHVTDGGVHDSISLSAADATIDGGGSYETVSAISSVVSLTFTGVSDVLTLSGAENAAGPPTAYVDDLSTGLTIFLDNYQAHGEQFPSTGNLTINGFDQTGLIDFLDGRGGFTSAAQAVSDLHQTAPGDYTLALPDGTGTITFLDAGHLTASNFKLG